MYNSGDCGSLIVLLDLQNTVGRVEVLVAVAGEGVALGVREPGEMGWDGMRLACQRTLLASRVSADATEGSARAASAAMRATMIEASVRRARRGMKLSERWERRKAR